MNALAKRVANPLARLSRKDSVLMRMFRNGAGRELNADEFDEAVMWCELYAANPIAQDIYFFVFDKDNAAKRRMVPVLSIGLHRKNAKRTGTYKPDERPPRIIKSDEAVNAGNPKGIVSAEVTVFLFAHGEWHPVTECLPWEARAPIQYKTDWIDTGEVWEDSGKKKKRKQVDYSNPIGLDPGKERWHFDGEGMLAKCAEMSAIRKGWPDVFAGTYGDGDLDQADVLDLSATEVLQEADKTQRQERIGGGSLTVDWCDGEPLQGVPPGQFVDRVMAWMREHDADRIALFQDRNRHTLKQFWALSPGDALELKREMEARNASA